MVYCTCAWASHQLLANPLLWYASVWGPLFFESLLRLVRHCRPAKILRILKTCSKVLLCKVLSCRNIVLASNRVFSGDNSITPCELCSFPCGCHCPCVHMGPHKNPSTPAIRVVAHRLKWSSHRELDRGNPGSGHSAQQSSTRNHSPIMKY